MYSSFFNPSMPFLSIYCTYGNSPGYVGGTAGHKGTVAMLRLNELSHVMTSRGQQRAPKGLQEQ